MIVRKIKKEELLEVCKLSSICFEYPFNPENKKESELLEEMLKKPESKGISYWEQIYASFDENGSLLSCLNEIPFHFAYDNTVKPAAGIGNVCTYPQHRKKGAVKAIFKYILPRMYQNGILFSYLYPFSEGFYRKFGYERIRNSISWYLDLKTLPAFAYDGSFTLYTRKEQLAGFKTAYTAFARKHNLMVMRDDMDWENITQAKAAYNNNYAYLYQDKKGTPRGYFVFKKEFCDGAPTMKCREFIFDGPETLRALLSFASTYAGDFRQIYFHAPSYYDLTAFCRDYPQSISKSQMAANGMARVVNARNVLLSSRYRGSGELIIKLTDEYIMENSHSYYIRYRDGRALSVEIADEADYDIAMSIASFSPAICGTLAARDLYYMEDVQIICEESRLRGVFFRKPCFINNYF